MRFCWLVAIGLLVSACGPAPSAPGVAAPQAQAPTGPVVTPLKASADVLDMVRGQVVAKGAEPFWRVTIDAKTGLSYIPADGEDKRAPYKPPVLANAGVILFASKDITIALREAKCSDGMSSVVYPMQATVTIGADVNLRGCAFSRWDNDLPQLIGAIDACLAKHGDPKAPVIWAARDETGASVRLKADAKGIECRVTLEGETTLTVPKGNFATHFASEMDPIFHRAPQPNPGGACFEADKAIGPKGEDLGWFSDEAGC